MSEAHKVPFLLELNFYLTILLEAYHAFIPRCNFMGIRHIDTSHTLRQIINVQNADRNAPFQTLVMSAKLDDWDEELSELLPIPGAGTIDCDLLSAFRGEYDTLKKCRRLLNSM